MCNINLNGIYIFLGSFVLRHCKLLTSRILDFKTFRTRLVGFYYDGAVRWIRPLDAEYDVWKKISAVCGLPIATCAEIGI